VADHFVPEDVDTDANQGERAGTRGVADHRMLSLPAGARADAGNR
jgi:hypothetical protein